MILADLLDDPGVEVAHAEPADSGVDLMLRDGHGRRWAVEVKASGGPAQVDRALRQLQALADPDAIPILVVPYMSKAGAEAAERSGLNWVDLSGNGAINEEGLRIWVWGRANELGAVGRPSSPFAPKSARVARWLLLEPERWWRQKDLAQATGLDDGNVSRVVRRLGDEELLERRGRELRPRDPDLLLDAWASEYRFDRHDEILGHLSGNGMELARDLSSRLLNADVDHAFTGLPAAWAIDRFAGFRLVSVYVEGDPREAADAVGMRWGSKGANLQILGPDDDGVFAGASRRDDLPCVAAVQVYLDLLHLPERAAEAAAHLRDHRLDWHARSR